MKKHGKLLMFLGLVFSSFSFIFASISVATAAPATLSETRAATYTETLTVKGFGGNTASGISAAGTDYTGTGSTTGVSYAMQVFNGSTGAIRGNQDKAQDNFSVRNKTAFDVFYISQIVVSINPDNTSTLDGATVNRSVVYFGSSAFSSPYDGIPSGTETPSAEGESGQKTLTWVNSDTSCNYFLLYHPRTTGTASAATVTVTWTYSGSINPTSVSLNHNAVSITIEDQQQLSATVAPWYATNKSVAWTSSDETVATVDSTGLVTSVGVGSATITVTTVAGARTDTCSVTVSGQSLFTRVTSSTVLGAGDLLIIVDAESEGKALGDDGTKNNRPAVNVTVTDGRIGTPDDGVQEIMLEDTGETDNSGRKKWWFRVGDDQYLYASSSSNNYLRTSSKKNAGDNGKWIICFGENDVLSVVAQGSNSHNLLQYNKSSALFSCYTSEQQPICIFRKRSRISRIATKTNPTTLSYYVGETFDPTGLVVTATYEDGSTADKSYASFSTQFSFSPAMSSPLRFGTESVTVSFTEISGTRSVDIDITVSKKSIKSMTSWNMTDESRAFTVIEGDTINPSATGFDFGSVTATYADDSTESLSFGAYSVGLYRKGTPNTLVRDIDPSTHAWTMDDNGLYLGAYYDEDYPLIAALSDTPVTVASALNSISFSETTSPTVWTWTAASGDLGTTASFSASLSGDESVLWASEEILDEGINRSFSVTRSLSGEDDKWKPYTQFTSNSIQLGKNGAPEIITLTSSAWSDLTITKVSVECASYDGKHNVAISVDGNDYLAATATSVWASGLGHNYGWGSSSGELSITFTPTTGARACYIKSISVTYLANASYTAQYANRNAVAQYAVTQFANYMNSQMNGSNVCSGTYANLETAWGNVADKYDELFGEDTALNPDELFIAKKMLSRVTGVWNESHDDNALYILERAMMTYDACVSARGMDDFMDGLREPLSLRMVSGGYSEPASPLTTTLWIVLASGVAGLSAIGVAYWISKKRRMTAE